MGVAETDVYGNRVGAGKVKREVWFLGICLDVGFGITVHTCSAQRL
jgi:hypothetical protein